MEILSIPFFGLQLFYLGFNAFIEPNKNLCWTPMKTAVMCKMINFTHKEISKLSP